MCGFRRCVPRMGQPPFMPQPIFLTCVPNQPMAPFPEPVETLGMPFPGATPIMPNTDVVERIFETPLRCEPTIINTHRRVEHFVPCVKTNIHHTHNHHVYIQFEQEEINEYFVHEHGERPDDVALCNSLR